MEIDSSDIVTAGVLSQKGPDGEWHLVAFYSKTMNPVECSYKIYNKELLAIMNSLRTWRAELEGIPNHFLYFIDYRALEFFGMKQLLNGRQIRWAEYLL